MAEIAVPIFTQACHRNTNFCGSVETTLKRQEFLIEILRMFQIILEPINVAVCIRHFLDHI